MGNHHSKHEDCPVHSLDEHALKPIFGSLSFYDFNERLAGACAGFATLVILTLMIIHATHLSKPNEQIKIMKIACLIPFYSIMSIVMIVSPKAAVYLDPWLDLVQAFALGSFFLLMCEFVSDNPTEQEMFFAALTIPNKKKTGAKAGGLPWFRKRWIAIFQYPVVATLLSALTDITEAAGVYCQYLSKPYYAHLWINLALNASLGFAVLSILRFYMALKKHLAEHKPLLKLLSFKLVVGVTFIIRIVYWILTDAKVINPTDTLTYADINIGIPNLIICMFMVPLSLFFTYAYSGGPYFLSHLSSTNTEVPPRYHGGFLGVKAWIQVLNPLETVRAILFSFRMAEQHTQSYQRQSDSLAGATQPLQNMQYDGYQNDGYGNKRWDRRQERWQRYY